MFMAIDSNRNDFCQKFSMSQNTRLFILFLAMSALASFAAYPLVLNSDCVKARSTII